MREKTSYNRKPLHANSMGHWSHLNGLTPLWRRTCCLRLLLLLKPFPHCAQRKGVSSLCVRMWSFRVQDCWKVLRQMWHLYGLEFGVISSGGSFDLRLVGGDLLPEKDFASLLESSGRVTGQFVELVELWLRSFLSWLSGILSSFSLETVSLIIPFVVFSHSILWSSTCCKSITIPVSTTSWITGSLFPVLSSLPDCVPLTHTRRNVSSVAKHCSRNSCETIRFARHAAQINCGPPSSRARPSEVHPVNIALRRIDCL